MKRALLAAVVAGTMLSSCGPPPAQVAGAYTGQANLFITGTTGENGSMGLNISQTGGDIAFTLSMCPVKASADSATSFKVSDFKCSKFLGSQTWEMTGTGKLTANVNSVNLTITGQAKEGAISTAFTWTYSGSRTP